MTTSLKQGHVGEDDNQGSYVKYPIFLSSLCGEIEPLREKVFLHAGKEAYVYVDEKVKRRNTKQQDDLLAADELIRRIREARVFVAILGSTHHGTPIRVGSIESSVSFFEVELFQAALLGKEIRMFVHENFNPEPRLKRLLEILGFYLPEWICQKRLTDKSIVDEVSRIVNRDRLTAPFRSIRHLYQPIRRYVQGLYAARANQRISFLEKEFEYRTDSPNVELIENVINSIETQTNEEKRLSRLWVGLRELMAAPYTTTTDSELIVYWDRLLGEWAKAGAWYGLHGDTPLGCLAALNSMAEVRLLLERERGEQRAESAYPGGPLASAKYSIAKRLYENEK